MSEYRMWVSVPGFPHYDEPLIDELHSTLERLHGDLGPVLTWGDGNFDDVVVILSTEAVDEATAAAVAIDAVVAALRACGHGDRYPSKLEIDDARHDQPASVPA